METILWVIIMTAIAGVGGTGLGGIVGASMKHDSKKIASLMLSFAAGIMLSIVCFDLIKDALHPQNSAQPISIWIVILGVFVGYGVIYLLNSAIDKATNHEIAHIDSDHPKTADDLDELFHENHYEEHKSKNSIPDLLIGGIVMACAIALHNLPEGMVIGASYAGETFAENAFSGSGFIMAIVIGLHNIPEGMAVSVPLISGGMSKIRAVLLTAMTGAPTIIGAVIGYYLGILNPLMLSLSLSFASGAMLYVVFGELLPESILMWKSKAPGFITIVGVMVGLLISNI
ncbi:MAG: ZIP family metal transporter [Oscillospiraceae bacterium]